MHEDLSLILKTDFRSEWGGSVCAYNLGACGVKIAPGLAGLSASLSTFSPSERSYPNKKRKNDDDECLLLRKTV